MRAWELYENAGGDALPSEQMDLFQSLLTKPVTDIGALYKNAGHDFRFVGGSVRDLFLGKTPKDKDFSTTATPQESSKLLRDAGYTTIENENQLAHGTIIVKIKGEDDFEITTLRADEETDGRHATVKFVTDWKTDAARRDLSYNAMSLDLEGNLYDYFHGVDDLKKGTSNFVGDSDQDSEQRATRRIEEDYLRTLRYFRFQGRLPKPQFDEGILKAIKNTAYGLNQLSGERVWDEMQKILSGDHTRKILDMMHKTTVDENIGLPLRYIDNIDVVKKHTNNSATILASLIKDEDQLREIASTDGWALSNTAENIILFIINHRKNDMSYTDVKNMWFNPKVDNMYISELMKYMGKDGILNKLHQEKVEKFPVAGKDLIAAGLTPGPQMGALLNDLNKEWVKSGHTKTWTDDEILDIVRKAQK